MRISALTLTLLATACTGAQPPTMPGQPVELTIAVLPVVDVLPLHYAIRMGLFRKQNLIIDPAKNLLLAGSGGDAVTRLVNGQVDIAFSSYTPFLAAKRGLATKPEAADIQLVADATSAPPGAYPVVTVDRSPIKKLDDIRRATTKPRIAITDPYTMSHYKAMSVLQTASIAPDAIEWTSLKFPEMEGALRDGSVDAAYMAEPWSTRAQKSLGAYPLFDSATGPTADMPMTGYGVKGRWAQEHPEALRAFQKVMVCATARLRDDRDQLNFLAQEVLRIDADTANIMTPPRFEVSLDPARLGRVRTLMAAFPEPTISGELPDVTSMIRTPPTLQESADACPGPG